jgi:hypothetical protein
MVIFAGGVPAASSITEEDEIAAAHSIITETAPAIHARRTLAEHDFIFRLLVSDRQGSSAQVASCKALCQGTTSVVPQMRHDKVGLQPLRDCPFRRNSCAEIPWRITYPQYGRAKWIVL